MSSLLPIFLNPQSGASAIDGGESAPEIVSQVNDEQAKSSGQAFTKAFSQALREHADASAVLRTLPSFVSDDIQQDAVLSPPILEKKIHHLAELVGSEPDEQLLGELQAIRGEKPLGDFLLPTSGSKSVQDLVKLVSAQSRLTPVVRPTEAVSPQIPAISIDQASFSGRVPTLPVSPVQESQPSPSLKFPENRIQSTGGDSLLKPVSQASAIDGNISRNGQIPLPPTLEAGSHHNQVSSGTKPEEALSIRTVAQATKIFPSDVQQLERTIQENETPQTPIHHRVSRPLVQPQSVHPQPIAPAAHISVEGPAGFAGPNLTQQIVTKPVPGNSVVASEPSESVLEHRTTVPGDVLRETGSLPKGDRGQPAVEVSVKGVGSDPSGGQGLGSGMNHFSNSQSGFQQSSMSSGQGVGIRGLEERGLEFPAPALQRLQMDVQLSETQRVQIDVGVQNRQVYAGLVMDHSVLRNLANQFVPQLENQLAEADLELQEFSAEVREDHEQEAHTMFEDSRSQESAKLGRGSQEELRSTPHSSRQLEEAGLHLLA